MEHSVKTLAKSFSKLKLVTDLFSVNTGGLYVCLESCVPGNQMYCDSQILISCFNGQNGHFMMLCAARLMTHFSFRKVKLKARHTKAKKTPAAARMEKMTVTGRATGITIGLGTPSYGTKPPRRSR